ncbi:MAG: hypothetical protein KGL39_55555 [Patescibacteria group bacterium]|nr:hypothetical protein [Patescibacteria group bacterium]
MTYEEASKQLLFDTGKVCFFRYNGKPVMGILGWRSRTCGCDVWKTPYGEEAVQWPLGTDQITDFQFDLKADPGKALPAFEPKAQNQEPPNQKPKHQNHWNSNRPTLHITINALMEYGNGFWVRGLDWSGSAMSKSGFSDAVKDFDEFVCYEFWKSHKDGSPILETKADKPMWDKWHLSMPIHKSDIILCCPEAIITRNIIGIL